MGDAADVRRGIEEEMEGLLYLHNHGMCGGECQFCCYEALAAREKKDIELDFQNK